MVIKRKNVYENHSAQGTLHLSIDNSKFQIKFYKSLKAEVTIDKDFPQENGVSSTLNSDQSRVPSHHTITKRTQKLVQDVSGQLIPIFPLAQVHLVKVKGNVSGKRSRIQNGDAIRHERNRRKTDADNQIIKDLNFNNGSENKNERLNNENSVGDDVCCNTSLHSKYPEENTAVSKEEDSSIAVEAMNEQVAVVNVEMPVLSNSKLEEDQVHYCNHCCKKFKTSQELKDHKQTKITTEYSCDECCEVFPFKGFLEVHKNSNHGSSGASVVYKDEQYWYSCDTCGTLVKTLVKLQLHNLIHTGEGYFQCCLCPEKYGERKDLSQHLKTHCHRSSGMTRCRWCNQWFATRTALATHKLFCKEVKCHLCNIIFPNVTSRNIHYKDFHSNDILKCKLCPKMFSSQEELDLHVTNHSKTKKKQCTLCGLFFSNLKKHMITHKSPSENEIFYCDKCPAKYSHRSTFTRHLTTHSREKPYQCPNCPRTFGNCQDLYKHIKKHSSLLPYACEVCDLNCQDIEQLKAHMSTHSVDNYHFPCSICTQSFMYKNSLQNHMRMKHPEASTFETPVAATVVTESQSFESVREISKEEAVQEITNSAAAFAHNPDNFIEVVIPGFTGLTDAEAAGSHQFEIVIIKKPS